MLVAFGVERMDSGEELLHLILMFLLIPFSVLIFTYAFSFLSNAYSGMQASIFIFYFFGGGIFTIAYFIMRIIEKTRNIIAVIGIFLRIFPPFLFGVSLIDISNAEVFRYFEDMPEDTSLFHWKLNGINIFFWFFDAFLWGSVIFLIEKFKNNKYKTFDPRRV